MSPVFRVRRALVATAVATLVLATALAASSSTASAGTTLAGDAFGRTTPTGWGSADVGGAWQAQGSDNSFSVSSGAGRLRLTAPAMSRRAILPGASARDVDARVNVGIDKAATGGGTYLSLLTRVSAAADYRFKTRILSNGSVEAYLVRYAGGTETVLTASRVPNLTYRAG